MGKPSFRDLTFTIHKSVFTYGTFITDLISFLAIAAAVFFFIVKPYEAVTSKPSVLIRKGTYHLWLSVFNSLIVATVVGLAFWIDLSFFSWATEAMTRGSPWHG